MNKKKLSLLMVLVALIVVLPAGIAVAKAAPQNITFNLADGSWQEQGIDPETGQATADYYEATVILTGKISDKSDGLYLSPLHGTLAVNGTEYSIQVKQIKQSEPLYSEKVIIYYPNSQQPRMVMVLTQGIVEVNVEGKKFIGWLNWNSTTMYFPNGDIQFQSGGTNLSLSGIVAGKMVSVSLAGEAPVIE